MRDSLDELGSVECSRERNALLAFLARADALNSFGLLGLFY